MEIDNKGTKDPNNKDITRINPLKKAKKVKKKIKKVKETVQDLKIEIEAIKKTQTKGILEMEKLGK